MDSGASPDRPGHDTQLRSLGSEPRICDRCGDFQPLLAYWGKALCRPCLAYPHPNLELPLVVRELLAESLALARALGPSALALMLGLSALQQLILHFLPAMVGGLALFVQALCVDMGYAILVHACLRLVLDGEGSPGIAASAQVISLRLLSLFGANLLIRLAVSMAFSCLVLPGLYAMGALSLSIAIVVREGRGPLEAMRQSVERLRGTAVWGRVLGALLLIYGPPMLLSWVPFSVPLLQGQPLASIAEQLPPWAQLWNALSLLLLAAVEVLGASLAAVLYLRRPPRLLLPQ